MRSHGPGPLLRRVGLPVALALVCASVYVAVLGPARRAGPSPDAHYVHLAASLLDGRLGVIGDVPPGTNDWACYDTVDRGPCPPGVYRFPEAERARYRWYVSFPPFPAVVVLPVVAALGTGFADRVFWALLAGLGPALLYGLLRASPTGGGRTRTATEDLGLSVLFAFGTVWFFTAVQGTVWFAAHVVAVPLVVVYAWASLDARRPLVAGLALALAFVTRPTTALLVVFFAVELGRRFRRAGAAADDGDDAERWWPRRAARWVAGVDARGAALPAARFAAPILVVGALAMWMNEARFDDPFEFGHRYLQIRWRDRIETWGLFSYHYLGRNLAVFVASLPWLSAEAPHLKVSLHGLALWFTTPNLLVALWPRRVDARQVALYLAVGGVALVDLLYQNSGWIQFGYRFALDWLPLGFLALARTGRRFRAGFWLVAVFAIAVNSFGAATFDRAWRFYDDDATQERLFQPD